MGGRGLINIIVKVPYSVINLISLVTYLFLGRINELRDNPNILSSLLKPNQAQFTFPFILTNITNKIKD